MKFSRQISVPYKGLHELIRAAEFKMAWYEKKIAESGSEDDISDFSNDAALLQIMLDYLKKEADDWARGIAKEYSLDRVPPPKPSLFRDGLFLLPFRRPARLVDLAGAPESERIRRHILGDDAPRRHIGSVADLHRRDQC